MYKKHILIFCIALQLAFNVYAKPLNTEVSIIGKSKIKLIINGKKKEYALAQQISGYKLNCKKNKIFIFGSPLKFDNNAPQAGYLTLIDLLNQKVIFSNPEGYGVMDVRYPKSDDWALVVIRYSYLINLKTGKFRELDPAYDPDTFSAENCSTSEIINVKHTKNSKNFNGE